MSFFLYDFTVKMAKNSNFYPNWEVKQNMHPRQMYARVLIFVLTPLDCRHQENSKTK